MKAITTRYLPATNTKGSRFKADDGDGNSVIVSGNTAQSPDEEHANAARSLCEKMHWTGTLQGGDQLKAGRTVAVVWCWIEKKEQVRV